MIRTCEPPRGRSPVRGTCMHLHGNILLHHATILHYPLHATKLKRAEMLQRGHAFNTNSPWVAAFIIFRSLVLDTHTRLGLDTRAYLVGGESHPSHGAAPTLPQHARMWCHSGGGHCSRGDGPTGPLLSAGAVGGTRSETGSLQEGLSGTSLLQEAAVTPGGVCHARDVRLYAHAP